MISKIISDPNHIPGTYARCLSCKYLDVGCSGSRTASMTLERWASFIKSIKEKHGFTNERISEISGVSLSTVEHIMKGKVSKDIMWSIVFQLMKGIQNLITSQKCSHMSYAIHL